MQRARWSDALLSVLLVLGVTLAFHWLLFPRIADPDSFYHVGHARLYAATSVMDTSFPWTAFSTIGDEGADLWWGFHMVLIPLSGGADVAAAVRRAAFGLTLAGLLLVAWLAIRHRLANAPLWALVFFLSVPNVLFRYLAVRPEVLSVPLALLLLSALVRRQPLLTLLLATAITWVHLSMFWMGPGIAMVWAGAVLADRWIAGPARSGALPGWPRQLPSMALLVGAGTALGWILRPHAPGAARLAWIQIAKLLFEKTGDAPLTFAVDLAPLDLHTLGVTAWPLLFPWAAALGWLAWTGLRRREALWNIPAAERILLWTTLVLAAGFLGMTVLLARRSLVHWAAFATVFAGVAFTHLSPAARKNVLSRALLMSLVPLFAFALWRNALNIQYVAQPPDTLEEVATWLADNSRPGDLVFNTHWDTFGPLFARDGVNRFVGGMDPIFQFARSPALYWEFHHLSTDAGAEVTCPDPVCSEENVKDSYGVFTEDFGARWILVEPRRNPRLTLHLLRDPRYNLALETQREAVFEILDEVPAPTGAESGSDARSSADPG